jgi:hypothetical protein
MGESVQYMVVLIVGDAGVGLLEYLYCFILRSKVRRLEKQAHVCGEKSEIGGAWCGKTCEGAQK